MENEHLKMFLQEQIIHPDYVVTVNNSSAVTITISGDETREKHTEISLFRLGSLFED